MAGNGVYRIYTLRSNLARLFRGRANQNRQKRALYFCPVLLVLRWQLQSLAQLRRRLVRRKAWSLRCNFEQDAARFTKIDRVEIESVDHGRDVQAGVGDFFSPMQLLLFVGAAKSNMVHRSRGIYPKLPIRALDQIERPAGEFWIH